MCISQSCIEAIEASIPVGISLGALSLIWCPRRPPMPRAGPALIVVKAALTELSGLLSSIHQSAHYIASISAVNTEI